MTVPFEEHPYSALAAWLKTDEGLEVLQALEKKLKLLTLYRVVISMR